MLLRAAALSDLPALVDLQQAGAVRALAHIFPQDTHPFPNATVLSRWAAEISDPAIEVYVIELEDRGVVTVGAAGHRRWPNDSRGEAGY